MPSFDIVCKPDTVEIRNAIDQSNKEIIGRFDFKGSDAKVERSDTEVTLFADSEFQCQQVLEIVLGKLTKRQVDVRYFDQGDIQKLGGEKVKQVLTIRAGLATEDGKKVVALIKSTKLKVQASIQGDTVRVQGAKKDDLQACMQHLKQNFTELPLSFDNFRS